MRSVHIHNNLKLCCPNDTDVQLIIHTQPAVFTRACFSDWTENVKRKQAEFKPEHSSRYDIVINDLPKESKSCRVMGLAV